MKFILMNEDYILMTMSFKCYLVLTRVVVRVESLDHYIIEYDIWILFPSPNTWE